MKNFLILATKFLSALKNTLMGLVVFLLVIISLRYQSLEWIEQNKPVVAALAFAVVCTLILLDIIAQLNENKTLSRLVTCIMIFLLIAVTIYYIICKLGLIAKITDIESLRDIISSYGAFMPLLFIAFQFLQVVILPVPGSVSVAVGVALFGPLWCSIYSFIGIVLGSFAAFAIGKWVGYSAICWIVGKDELDAWLKKVKGKDYLILTIMFLLPLFPDDVLCFVAGLSSMTWVYFSVMIVFSRAVSVVTTAYSVELIPFTTWWGISIWIGICILVGLAFWLVLKYSDKIDAFIKRVFLKKNK